MKTLTMYRPHTIQNALNDFDRYFESFFGDSFLSPSIRAQRMPAVDIRENEKAYVLEMELPGHDEKDIEISVDGNNLSIASRQEEIHDADDGSKRTEAHDGTWLLRERRLNTFNRSFKLPENANPEGITAEFKNGILRMEIHKRAEAQKRTIHINAR